jgi:hypothetical protein
MSDNRQVEPNSIEQPTDAQLTAQQLGRRLFVFRAAAVSIAVPTSVLGTTSEAPAQDPGRWRGEDPGRWRGSDPGRWRGPDPGRWRGPDPGRWRGPDPGRS